MTQPVLAHDCANCPAHHLGNLVRLGVDMSDWDYVVAPGPATRTRERARSSTP